ncbi:MAG TPA: glycosyltransferase family 39 protein [Patescibacteria group bacterium]|nr:glycosyltransferase family 39 protein [Patescibacteria group bacterium]
MLKIIYFMKANSSKLTFLIFGVIFFVLYSYLAFNTAVSWTGSPKLIQNSPDETANLYFSHLFSQSGRLAFTEPANQIAVDLVAPRSMRVIGGQTAPAGFLGLPIIYGSLAKIAGAGAMPFFTPLLAILALGFFYFLIKELFNEKIAFLSAAFAFIFPGWWYYAARGMLPNVAFLSFFIIAFYFFIRLLKQPKIFYYLLFGFFLALSLMVRTSEIVWTLPLLLILTLLNFKKINWLRFGLSVLLFIICFFPVFYYNFQIYGSPLSIGYGLTRDFSGQNLVQQGLNLSQKILLPFGFNPGLALKNFYNYTAGIFPLWTLLFGLGLLISILYRKLIKPDKRKTFYLYLLLLIFFGGYLVIYYGSWSFHDHPDPAAVTIGTSYIRYWLPLYLFSLPLLAIVLDFCFQKKKNLNRLLTVYIWLALFFTSYQLAVLDPSEGILQVQKNIAGYQSLAADVIKRTPENAVIIAERMDKVFWPARSVIYALNRDYDYVRIKELITNGWPVYWFSFTLTDESRNLINQNSYAKFGLRAEKSVLDFNNQSLYPINIITN